MAKGRASSPSALNGGGLSGPLPRRQDKLKPGAVGDADGRHRLAHATEDMAAQEGRLGACFMDFPVVLGFPLMAHFAKERHE